ncbi:Methyltransferase type 11 domain protein [Rhodopirellula maiorica SM1]|uniref:Methyltransferase type 11 domain protein n=1 Tax=Rhodopirellula maiorica SM1 TaxID=1265738 RepID=M5RBD9_9BACT|nr:Methyltransferase type 11 domain protein [Rhodopirellula maiorica SM1]
MNERTIADHYDSFVADTPLCALDQAVLKEVFPGTISDDSRESMTSIVDLGCGSGRVAMELAHRGYRVVGVDLSQRMLEVMMAKASQQQLQERIHAVRANLVQLDCFADQSIDHAVCLFSTLGMIQGRENRQQMLRHVARVVRPQGRFVLHVHNRWSALVEPAGWRSLVRSWVKSRWQSDHEFGDSVYQYRGLEKMFMHRFSRRELIANLQATQWGVAEFHSLSIDGASIATGSGSRVGGFIVVAENHSAHA